MITSLQLTQSMSEYAVLSGSNTFVGNQNITGDLTVTGTLTVPVIHTIYETASVIYSSGSNQFGDELTDVQTLSGSVKIQGNLTINGIPLSSGSDLTSLNAFTQSQNTKNSTLATYTASVDTKFTTIGTYTASNDTKWNTLSGLTGSYATTGSNRFTGNQFIDKANVLYTNGIYWTSSEVGYNNLEIINSATGNLDLAALNGRVRIVSSSLDITNGTFTASLQEGYVWVGNGSGRTSLVPTSSFAENTDLTSLNAFTASQEILNTTFATTGSNTFTGYNTFNQQVDIKNGQAILMYGNDNNPSTAFGVRTTSGSFEIVKLGLASKVDLQNTSLLVSGTFTSSLQQGYVWVGDSNGKTTTVPTSSFGSNINTGSFATTGSNIFNGNQTITGSLNTQGNLNVYGTSNFISGAVQVRGNAFTIENTSSQTKFGVFPAAGLVQSLLPLEVQATFTASLQQGYAWVGGVGDVSKLVPTSSFVSTPTDISALNAFTQSQDTKNSTLSTYTASVDQKFSNIGSQSGSWDNTNLNSFTQSVDTKFTAVGASTSSLNAFTSSQDTKNSTLASYTSSNDTKWSNLGSQSGSFVTESETGSFARTNVDNNFSANQTFTNITAVSASFTYVQTLYETASVIYSSGSNQFGDELSDIQTLSGSVKIQGNLTINGTPVQTSSVDISSLNAFTQSQDTKNNTLGSYTASVDTKFVAVGSSTASLNSYTSSQDNKNSTLGIYTASVDTKFSTIGTQSGSWDNTALNTFTQSVDTKFTAVGSSTSSLNAYTQSNDTKWSNLASQSGSWVTSAITGSSLITASFSGNTLTFTKGDATTFGIVIPDASGSVIPAGTISGSTQIIELGFQTTASFNAYTQSNDSKVNNLINATGSYAISSSVAAVDAAQQLQINSLIAATGSYITASVDITSLNQFTQSQESKNTTLASVTSSLNSATASLFTSASLGLTTASFSGNTLTFTKGDSSTFGVLLPDVSGSDISALNAFTQSQDTKNTAVGYSTSSLNSFTSSQESKNSTLSTYTASVDTKFSTIGTQSGSWENIPLTSLNAFTQSVDSKFVAVGESTASLNAYTQSNDTKWSTLGGLTGSYVTSAITGSSLVTASFSGNTLTFTKGDSSTFGVVIPDVSGSDLSALNAFTQSQDTKNIAVGSSTASLNSYTSSQDTKNSTLATYTSSIDTKFATIGSQSGSWSGGGTDTGSLMVTGSVAGNVLTFTKGDSSQFSLTVATGSGGGGSTDTGSLLVTASFNATTRNITFTKGDASQFNISGFATTGSNTGNNRFVGEQQITSSLDGLTLLGYGNRLNFGANTNTDRAWLSLAESDGNNQGTTLNFTGANTGVVFAINDTATPSTGSTPVSFENTSRSGSILFLNSGNTGTIKFDNATGSIQLKAGSSISISGSSTTIQDVNFIPFSASLNSRILAVTGSGGSTDTGSLLVTASFNGNTKEITFTKGNATQFVLGGFATTGSNTFRGSQTIETSSVLTVGSNEEFIKTEFNNFTLQNKTSVFVNYLAPVTQFQSNGNFNFQNTVSSVGSGSTAFLIQNGGGYSTTAEGGGNIQFTTSGSSGGNIGFTAGVGSITSNITNGGNYSATVNGGGSISFTTGTGSISLTTQQELNLQSNVIKIKSKDASFTTQIINASGSLMLATAANTTASAHIAQSSGNSQINLIFKNNNNTGTTIISGSNNIFTNPNTPTTGYTRFIGGNNNLYLNSSNGITSQITASATTVSGATPTMNNNIFAGTGNFSINQAVNTGTHTYSQNIITGTGTTTINALGFTGSLNLQSNFNNNGTITVNAASASVAEIASGLSGSGTININNNGNFGGTMTITSPRTLITSNNQNVLSNILAAGAITITNISSSAQVVASSNIGASSFTYSNAGAAGLGLHTGVGSMSSNYGGMSLIASASAIQAGSNISPAPMAVTNRMFSGSLGLGVLNFNNNQIQGGSNTYTVSGSYGGTSNTTGPAMIANGIFGASNTIFTNVEGRGNYVDVRNNLIGGTFLILTGSNNLATTGSGGGYFGRFNANDGRRNGTAENILVVGTGTSEANRKTGFLIDSGSNTFIEGTLNVSGSTTITGSLNVTSLIVSGSTQFNVGAFNSTITQSGSAAVSQSMTFNNTDITEGVTLNGGGTQLTLTNSGTYNIQFSAQVLAGTGADTIWIWLKKNGTNVSNTATKLVLRNNEADVAAWNFVVPAVGTDYFELVWQSVDGHATLLTEAASGNYPAIPSVIVTVTQVR
jgi:hypothetical protein